VAVKVVEVLLWKKRVCRQEMFRGVDGRGGEVSSRVEVK
jgi:hypothetical protein